MLESAKTAVLEKINGILNKKPFAVIAADGRCGAGKSALASLIKAETDCNILHMDDFFLRPGMRTKERLSEPGGNVDYERFLSEAIIPLKKRVPFYYRPYSCRTGDFSEQVFVNPKTVTVVEGSYSCHPSLWDFYDLHVFLTVNPKEQLERIIGRGGEAAAEAFKSKWIPLEELYFGAFDIENRCELRFDTSSR